MTDRITPEAIEAVATLLLKCRVDDDAPVSLIRFEGDRTHIAWVVLTEIRDAIHRDGPDADAIRDALGLERFVTNSVTLGPDKAAERGVVESRVVSRWKEVGP